MTDSAPQTVKQVLNQAADVIERNGLCRGLYFRKKYPFQPIRNACMCATGAINFVTTGDPRWGGDRGTQNFAAWVQLCDYLVGRGEPSIVDWNDSSYKEQVVAGLRAAANV